MQPTQGVRDPLERLKNARRSSPRRKSDAQGTGPLSIRPAVVAALPERNLRIPTRHRWSPTLAGHAGGRTFE
jgi:hypothetical protein